MLTYNSLLDIYPETSFENKDSKVANLEIELQKTIEELAFERILRKDAEDKIQKLEQKITELEAIKVRKRRTKAEMAALDTNEYSEFKSDGKRKPRPVSAIRSYEDFKAIQDYYLSKNRIRDYALWTVGVSLGLRISDLLSLKICNFLNKDGTFRERVTILEHKTSKANNCLITESVRESLTKYFISINYQFNFDDIVFKSHKTKGKMEEEYGWKILSDAGKALSLPIVVGSHTMRKSFANIAACVDKSSVDMNSITKIQGLLNHSDQRVTMRYLGTYQQMFDKARQSVSDFVLGKTNIHELIAGNNFTIDDVMSKLDTLLDENKK